jgi:glyoxylase-like metal-dependent hydrolase (beta-lactamase superfamily II)/rhodanese-related sulfurtransferase
MKERIISVNELQEKLNNNERMFIVDVRPVQQRKEWKIGGSVHIDAYRQLNAGDDTALDHLDVPEGTTVVTVCAAGKTSLLASTLLQRKGIEAYSLEGGMKAWNYAWNTAGLASGSNEKVIQVRRPAKGVLSYIVGSQNEAIVIDAALDPTVYRKIADENHWTIKYVLDTHIHADYVSRTRDLAKATNAKHLLIDKAPVEFDATLISSGQTVTFGVSKVEFIHTPGHTWESTTFNVLFTGDTLFIDSIGRPDLKADHEEAARKAKALYKSLNQLFSFHPGTIVLPAHTSDTVAFDNKIIGEQIGNIKKRMAIAGLSESAFVDYILSKTPPAPPNYLTIAALNKKGTYEGHELADLEAGGNHCAIA